MSQRLSSLKPQQVLRALQRAGFYRSSHQRSSLYRKHPDQPNLRVTVAYHAKDLKRRSLESIVEQSGLTTEEFLALL